MQEKILQIVLEALMQNASNYPNLIMTVDKVEDDTIAIHTVDGEDLFLTLSEA